MHYREWFAAKPAQKSTKNAEQDRQNPTTPSESHHIGSIHSSSAVIVAFIVPTSFKTLLLSFSVDPNVRRVAIITCILKTHTEPGNIRASP